MNGRDSSITARFEVSPSCCSLASGRERGHARRLITLWIATFAWTTVAIAQQHAIDIEKSAMTVRVYKAGLLSGLGHEHEIAAPIASGLVDTAVRRVELLVKAGALRVRDPGVSGKDRTEIQRTMLGPEVLEAERHPEIIFRSRSVEPMRTGSWRVEGELTLHGQTHPVVVDVRETNGHYEGTSHFKQTDFGIKPIKVAGGTIRVKDEIRIEFDIQLAH